MDIEQQTNNQPLTAEYADANEYPQEFATYGQTSGIEIEQEEERPFNAEKISVSTMPVTLSRLLERIASGAISSPEIQRNDNLWDVEKKSRLIESLMIKIPLPLFYVAADPDENWKIVDGLQRVSTIKQFMLECSFTLKNLEFLSEYNGYAFKELPDKYQNRIKDAQFQFAIISATTPQEVQRNIFKRLNTGGLPLTLQEVRHALYYKHETNQFLVELTESKEFLDATTKSVNDARMAARELVLRFISFLVRGPEQYPKNHDMDEFLSDTMLFLNAMPEMDAKTLERSFYGRQVNHKCKYTDYEGIRSLFNLGMTRAGELFGLHAFRKSTQYSQYRAPINKSLFECVSITLSQLSPSQYDALVSDKDTLVAYLHHEYQNNIELYNTISRDSQKHASIQYRFNWFQDLFSTWNNGRQ
ncbi:MAG: DUF262 domain-containing protein [Oscillospiraceae bacterium]|nr:DUF262 domain-containing protein [Oscillospiraceae bacterium]